MKQLKIDPTIRDENSLHTPNSYGRKAGLWHAVLGRPLNSNAWIPSANLATLRAYHLVTDTQLPRCLQSRQGCKAAMQDCHEPIACMSQAHDMHITSSCLSHAFRSQDRFHSLNSHPSVFSLPKPKTLLQDCGKPVASLSHAHHKPFTRMSRLQAHHVLSQPRQLPQPRWLLQCLQPGQASKGTVQGHHKSVTCMSQACHMYSSPSHAFHTVRQLPQPRRARNASHVPYQKACL